MTYRPKRPCTHPGCNIETTEGKCPLHLKQSRSNYDRFRRDPESRKFYNSAKWKGLVAACRSRDDGLCQECRKQGKDVLGSTAAHIVPRELGGPDDLNNLRFLCTSCHSRESAERGERWRN